MSAVSDAIRKLQMLINTNLEEDEFTTVEFAKEMGVDVRKAYRILNRSGAYDSRLGKVGGCQVSIWKEKK